jgi:hypothetical protein
MDNTKRKPTPLARHRRAMKEAREQLRRAEAEGWAWDALFLMLRRVLDLTARGVRL